MEHDTYTGYVSYLWMLFHSAFVCQCPVRIPEIYKRHVKDKLCFSQNDEKENNDLVLSDPTVYLVLPLFSAVTDSSAFFA